MAAAAEASARAAAGRDYPANLGEFFEWFQTDEDCWRYLLHLRWPEGFRCPACGGQDAWLSRRRLFVCTDCRHQTSVRTDYETIVWSRRSQMTKLRGRERARSGR